MSLIPHGICILFGQGNPFQGINDLFKGLEELAMAIVAAIIFFLIILVVVLIVAGVGLGAITGMVFKKAASDELDEVETGSTTVTSRIRGCLILLAGPVFGVGALLFSFSAFLAAENRGFDEDWLPVVVILGVVVGIVFAAWYQRRRIRRLGEEKANGILFLFGLLVSSVFIGVMGSVSVTSLVYIAWEKMEPPPLEQQLKSSLEIDKSDNIIAIKLDTEYLSWNDLRSWGKLVSEEVRTVRKIELLGDKVTNEMFVHFENLPELEELYIHSSTVTDEVMLYLVKIKTLKRLTIEGNISDEGFKGFQQLGQLTDLDVSKTVGTDVGMQHLRSLTNLSSLAVPQRVTGRGLVHLQDMQLKSLILPASAKTDLGLEHYVVACEPQAELDLTSWEGVEGPGLLFLRDWLPLNKLTLKIEDSALFYLGQLAGIVELSISESDVSDAAIEHLPRLDFHLKRLDVSQTNVSLQGLSQLRSALPECVVTGAKLRSRINRATYHSRYAAIEFDGRESYLSVGSFKYDGSYPLTAEVWVWPALEEYAGAIMGNARQSGFTLSLDSERLIHVSFHGRGATTRVQSDMAIPVRAWSHVAFVYDGNAVTLFVNGMQQNQPTGVRREHHASRKLFMMGADPSYTNKATNIFAGVIREVRLSRTVRYDQSFIPIERFQSDAETIALYHMDAMVGDTVEDATGNGHTASINGATWLAVQSGDDHKSAPPEEK